MDWRNENGNLSIIPPVSSSYLKERLRKYLSKETKQERATAAKNTFWGYYDNFLLRMDNGSRVHSQKGTPLAKGFIFQFHNLKRHLQKFEAKTGSKLTFEGIDLVFYKKFIDYETITLKLAPNTIGKLITNLKVFLREAYEDNVTTNNIFTHRKFKTINSVSDTVYLTPLEIEEMRELDLSNAPRLDRVRDMFTIGCYTGLRYGDLTSIQPSNIQDGIITIIQGKTGDEVQIPFTGKVLKILDNYGN